MRFFSFVTVVYALVLPALAQEPVGCDKFRWPLDKERATDVVQDGHRVRSTAATGATGCEGVRKSVKFELAASPFTVQLTGIEANTIGLVIGGE